MKPLLILFARSNSLLLNLVQSVPYCLQTTMDCLIFPKHMAFATVALPWKPLFGARRFTARRPRTFSNTPVRITRTPVMCAKWDEDHFGEDFPSSAASADHTTSAHDTMGNSLVVPAREQVFIRAKPAERAGLAADAAESKVLGDNELEEEGEPEICIGDMVHSPSLAEYREQREAALLPPALDVHHSEFSDAWALAVSPRKAAELTNQYSRVGVLITSNFDDFGPNEGCLDAYNNASLVDIAMTKAKAVYEGTGLPAIAEMHDMTIDAPESNGRINKNFQQGYYTRDVAGEGDTLIDRVRPVSDENRMTKFTCSVAYYDGEVELVTTKVANVAMYFSGAHYVTLAIAAALDDLYKLLSTRLGLSLDNPGGRKNMQDEHEDGEQGKVLVGAEMLRERILREGKLLNDGIIKVSSFMNHMVDTELMEVCGEELAERLRHTMPNKLLTVESTGLIVGLPTAKELGIPLVFARKSRPITISDSYQTTYRSATKGTTNELIVSCEYLEAGDRVLIIDDFLAGGSTAEALFKLAKMAHAKVVGVGVLIEKMSDGGRAFLSGYDVPVESLAKIILSVGDKGRINFVDEEPWVSPSVKKDRQMQQERKREAELYGQQDRDTPDESLMDMEMEDGNDDDGGVDVINWDDDDVADGELYKDLDDIEDELIRAVGKV